MQPSWFDIYRSNTEVVDYNSLSSFNCYLYEGVVYC